MFFSFFVTERGVCMIEINNICFSFGDKVIFNKLNAVFEKGQFCSIIGPNGSGKTTLLKLLSALYKPTSGNIIIDGSDILTIRQRELSKRIAVLPQEKNKTAVSVYDYIASGRYPYHGSFGKYTSEDSEITVSSAKKTGVFDLLSKDIRFLSGGERQRVYIAAVLAQDTPYIILDEPTTFLDIANKFEIMAFFRAISNSGKGIIAVLHDISLAMKFSDKILILDRAKGISEMLLPDELYESGLIDSVFNVKCSKVEFDEKTEYFLTK